MHLPSMNADSALRPSRNIYAAEPVVARDFFAPGDQTGIVPQACAGCAAAAAAAPETAAAAYVYAIGNVRPIFPSLSVEKEFYQAINVTEFERHPDEELLFRVLSKGENRYIAREMCWVFSIYGVDLYLLKPESERELTSLLKAIATRGVFEYDVIVGTRGARSGPDECNGIELPVVQLAQAFSFTAQEYVTSIQNDTGADESLAGEIFDRMLTLVDNRGEQDAHRAINFMLLKYQGIFATAYDMSQKDYSLTSVHASDSRIQGNRKILDVVFSYHNDKTNVRQRWFARVDVSAHLPFLVSGLARYYDQP